MQYLQIAQCLPWRHNYVYGIHNSIKRSFPMQRILSALKRPLRWYCVWNNIELSTVDYANQVRRINEQGLLHSCTFRDVSTTFIATEVSRVALWRSGVPIKGKLFIAAVCQPKTRGDVYRERPLLCAVYGCHWWRLYHITKGCSETNVSPHTLPVVWSLLRMCCMYIGIQQIPNAIPSLWMKETFVL